MSLLILAKLAGQTNPKGIAGWVSEGAEWLRPVFKGNSLRLPCANTYSNMGGGVAVADLNRVIRPLVGKAPGRLEVRQISVSSAMKAFLADAWLGIEQVFRLERHLPKKGQSRSEVVYGMTSLPHSCAVPAKLLALGRVPGLIENRWHWRCQVSLGEDASQVKEGLVPPVLAALYNLVLALLDFQELPNLPTK